jgi:hypothetical protein
VVTGVVCKSQCRHTKFPVQGGLIDKCSEIFGASFVAYFSLTVALGMIASSSGVTHIQGTKKLFSHFVSKFFPLVSNKFKRKAMATNPAIQQSRRDSKCLFIWQYDEFDIFGEGVSDA